MTFKCGKAAQVKLAKELRMQQKERHGKLIKRLEAKSTKNGDIWSEMAQELKAAGA